MHSDRYKCVCSLCAENTVSLPGELAGVGARGARLPKQDTNCRHHNVAALEHTCVIQPMLQASGWRAYSLGKRCRSKGSRATFPFADPGIVLQVNLRSPHAPDTLASRQAIE